MASTAALRGGMIGCGFFARNHLHGWREVEGAAIVALCDRDVARAQAYAADFGVARAYGDPEGMLAAEGLDFVDIVTPPATHRPLVELAARQGVDVICQKPVAPTLADARAMVAACRAASVRFMVHENFRWQTGMRALRRLARERDLGDPFFARIAFRSGYDVYRDQPYLARQERFILEDLGIHLLDLARFFLGDMERLYCQTNRVNPGIRGEDAATVLLRTAGGATCVVELSYASRPEEELFPQTLVHLEGPRGTATLGPHYDIAVTTAGGTERSTHAPRQYPWSIPMMAAVQDSVVAIQRHWVDCLRDGRAPETSGEDNLRTVELLHGAYTSAATGLPYTIGGPDGD